MFYELANHNSSLKTVKYFMSYDARKPVFGVFDQVRHKPGCAATEDVKRLEISDLESRGIVLSIERIQRCRSTAQLICVFVFANAKVRFSHGAALII